LRLGTLVYRLVIISGFLFRRLPIMCAIAHVPLEKWYRFFLPFFLIAVAFQGFFIAAAVALGV
jgi:uncharacterized ion transporter superfamily protein YfcC